MTGAINTLISIRSALISDPMKSITALAAIISAFAATGGLIIAWKNYKKDITRVSVVVKRAHNGPLVLQYPQKEFLLFEVYNQGISPVVINEVGITIPGKAWSKSKFINLVDLPFSHLDLKDQENAIGTLECVVVPGTIPARSTGIFLLNYSGLKEAFASQRQNISSNNLGFVGRQRIMRTFQQFQTLELPQGEYLQIIPYILTGSGDYFVGKKAIIKLGNLGDTVA